MLVAIEDTRPPVATPVQPGSPQTTKKITATLPAGAAVHQALSASAFAPQISATALHSFEISVNSYTTLSVDSTDFEELLKKIANKLDCQPQDIVLDYVETAKMRVVDERTLSAAAQLHSTMDADSAALPLKLTVVSRKAAFPVLGAIALFGQSLLKLFQPTQASRRSPPSRLSARTSKRATAHQPPRRANRTLL